MPSIHSPERQPGESQSDYRDRRTASTKAVRAMRLVGASGGTTSRESQRKTKRENGKLVGNYSGGLLQPQRQRNVKRMEKIHGLRDGWGAFTLTGQPQEGVYVGNSVRGRRIWLGGISARRGY